MPPLLPLGGATPRYPPGHARWKSDDIGRAAVVLRCVQGDGGFMSYDASRVRPGYPALRDGHAYLDGAAGTQVPDAVIAAIAEAYRAGIGNVGGAFAASDRSGAIVARARQAVADLVGGVPAG